MNRQVWAQICTRSPDRSGPEDGLDAQHHPRGVLDQADVAPHQLLESEDFWGAVVDRLECPQPQELGELVGIDAVVLVGQLTAPRTLQTITRSA